MRRKMSASHNKAAYKMKFIEAVEKTIKEAEQSGNLMRLYNRKSGYFISEEYWNNQSFQAYPGGRKIMSLAGKKILDSNRAAYRI